MRMCFPIVSISLTAILVCTASFLLYFYFQRRFLNRLNQILDDAIAGKLTTEHYDEKLLSAFESRLMRYTKMRDSQNQKISESQAQIQSFIADISHQTKTPIANILLYGELLQESDLPQEAQNHMHILLQQTHQLDFLIHALLTASRLEHNLITMHPGTYPAEDLIEKTLESIQGKAKAKAISFDVNIEPSSVFYDPKWTAEALYNLLDNAIKYSEKKTHVKVYGSSYELFYRIDIVDEGIGIEPSEQALIFSRFYRSPQVSQVEGVGIGLYLTREIISQQNGYIQVSSQAHKGTQFSVFLPLSPP